MFKHRWLLEQPLRKFEDGEADLMQRIFDDIWGEYEFQFVDPDFRTIASHELARAILKTVTSGERNVGVIKAYATGLMMLYRDFHRET
jgi:hypothetical protein